MDLNHLDAFAVGRDHPDYLTQLLQEGRPIALYDAEGNQIALALPLIALKVLAAMFQRQGAEAQAEHFREVSVPAINQHIDRVVEGRDRHWQQKFSESKGTASSAVQLPKEGNGQAVNLNLNITLEQGKTRKRIVHDARGEIVGIEEEPIDPKANQSALNGPAGHDVERLI